jgi:hypothetical protein
VATNAVSGDVYVIEIRRQPCHRGMTIVTSVVAVNMSWMLACRSEPVMAGAAGAQDLGMVDGIRR